MKIYPLHLSSIIGDTNNLVVIKKNGGPYINRYNLPGGSLEDGEPLVTAIVREIKEETGLTPTQLTQLGITSFRYPWQYEKWAYNQHICVFYKVERLEGVITATVKQFEGQDSLGAESVPLERLNISNSSPLVLKAKDYLLNKNKFDSQDQTFSTWQVLTTSVY